MRGIFFLLFFLAITILGNAQTVEVSKFLIGKDYTGAMKRAFGSENDTLIVDKLDTPWIIGPMEFQGLKNKVIIIEPNVEIRAENGVFVKTSDALFEFQNCENISIIGNGSKLSMNKDEYLDGEWRHGISIRKCKNMKIDNLCIEDTGGDGIYIAGFGKGSYSENIFLSRIIATNNKRQGISIISGKNITVSESVFQETKGTLPGAGVDLEPNSKLDRLINITFSNCIFRNNDHAGILLALSKLDSTSEPVSINFKKCVLQNNHHPDNKYVASEIVFGAHKTSPVQGKVVLKDCIVENSKWGLFYSRKTKEAYSVEFKDCLARNICQDNSYPPIYLEVPDYYKGDFSLGGFKFQNLYLDYASELPVFLVRGSTMKTLGRLAEITGEIFIKNKKKNKFKYIKYDPSQNKNVRLAITIGQSAQD
ncbi:right-handed parallel beta-helix repeat-containing protein [Pareuzebyella sediminis]|uniref:right-handed parallel beta-helix repeat-containing protein n=1 Tax=Pareuzebyella sediminis TaxID=2607998 RepID=UPI0011ECAD03|nr:right-handed parallel beta-helix repeat-containing protein [Pareuzebyella sediminis]